MSNSFYNATGVPSVSSAASSSSIRGEFAAIGAAFNLFPVLSSNASKPLIVNAGGTGLDVAPNAYVDVATNQTVAGVKTFSSSPIVPTATAGNNTTNAASTAFVTGAVSTAVSTEVSNRNTAIANSIATEVTNRNAAISSLVPSGTRMLFVQAAAPTGWVQDFTDIANNRMLRVVADLGGGIAGIHNPTIMNVVPAHTHGFTTGGDSNDHTHADLGHSHSYVTKTTLAVQSGNATPCWIGEGLSNTGTGYANLGGISQVHTHSGSTDNGSSQVNWQPRYTNVIICQKS